MVGVVLCIALAKQLDSMNAASEREIQIERESQSKFKAQLSALTEESEALKERLHRHSESAGEHKSAAAAERRAAESKVDELTAALDSERKKRAGMCHASCVVPVPRLHRISLALRRVR